ncbi:ribonuclease E/G [Rhodosalinus halophilus]|uniref:Ribonuclease E n=1 Tax=Rhodosalinus halophilus TaxID=2259333 RepID=A0A365UCS1_9RHOB|nr:ribonuclease E/G [Rhodosalinus halophilus]RBI86828.1 ribonuclease E/G [Rhodosalinus halophilus]
MPKKMLIDATHAEETRVVVVDGNKVEDFDFESVNKRQLAGNIYLAKVTRVEPSLQAAFVDYGGNRHGFLAFSEIHPDYYQIPVADREALMEEERAYAEAQRARDEAEDEGKKPKKPARSRSRSKAAKAKDQDAVAKGDIVSESIEGMETIDLSDGEEGLSPMERVGETPVEEPEGNGAAAEPNGDDEEEAPFVAADHAAERDETIEAVSEVDDQEDIRPPRKPRPRKYKIQEVIKVRQIMLVQVVKEERGNKGAALTTYLSLAGRYCVLMPNTARGGGISRKITNAADRKKLKEIAQSLDVPRGAGLIVRTAGAKRTKTEIKRDYEYLQRLWEQIRELTLQSIAPAKIYEEGDLIKRSIRDLYNREIDEVLVEGEAGYRNAKDFMKMIMPSHAKNVKHYQDPLPLFARYQVESYLGSMFNPTVQLKSGGYIVIGVTEALVAIDVNSGKATREGSIEETALKTNLEAAEEIARQLRLRDLAGLIVIDFIDMDERKNNAAVEKKLKDKLKNDRARIQVGRISGFGLLEMSRQRLRPGMIEATTQPCPACHGTGLIRSDDNLALAILRQIEEEGVRGRSREVLIKCPVAIANFLMNQKREHIAQIEARYGLSVRVEGDPMLVSPDYVVEKFKQATRPVPDTAAPVVSLAASAMQEETQEEPAEAPEEAQAAEEPKPAKKKRRRRRRRKPSSSGAQAGQENGEDMSLSASAGAQSPAEAGEPLEAESQSPHPAGESPAAAEEAPAEAEKADAEAEAPAPKRRTTRKRSSSSRKPKTAKAEGDAPAAETVSEAGAEAAPAPGGQGAQEEAVASTTAPVAEEATATPESEEAPAAPEAEEAPAAPKAEEAPAAPEARGPAPAPADSERRTEKAAPRPAAEGSARDEAAGASREEDKVPETVGPAQEDEEKSKPKKRGWWMLGPR